VSVFGLTIRGLLLRPRTAGLALLPIGVGILAVLVSALAQPGNLGDAFGLVSGTLMLSLVVALVALVLAGNAFGDEREGGTLPLLMATATPRWRIVAAKLVAAWLATWVVCLPAVLGCIVLGLAAPGLPDGDVVASVLLASVLTTGGYSALFVVLSLVSSRGLLIGLAYVVVWEGSLAGFTTALRNLSVGAYARRVVAAPFEGTQDLVFEVADTGVVGACIVLTLLVVVGYAVSAWRLPRLEIR
jgi:ABC-2 type transport system permease protein